MAVFIKLDENEAQSSKREALEAIVLMLRIISSIEKTQALRGEKAKAISEASSDIKKMNNEVVRLMDLLPLEEVEAKTGEHVHEFKKTEAKKLEFAPMQKAKVKSEIKADKYEEELRAIKERLEKL